MTSTAVDNATIPVEVLVCGSSDRGDDAAPAIAARQLADVGPRGIQFTHVGQLDVDDLLAVRHGACAIVVDTAVGVEPGRVVVLPLNGLIGRGSRIRPRSSHALAIPEVVGVADIVRGHPLTGCVVVIGGSRFGLGDALGDAVERGIPSLMKTIVDVAERLREGHAVVGQPARPAMAKRGT